MSGQQQAVWARHASQWARVGAPLRPSVIDGQLMLEALRPVLAESASHATVVVLGVTPELVTLDWPASVEVRAFDHSQQMVDSVWRPHPRNRSSAACAPWQSLPIETGSIRAGVGDGSLNVLAKLADYEAVLSEVHRVLEPAGLFALRCFVRPDQPESLGTVMSDAWEGRIGSFHAFKWRLAMALVDEATASVEVDAVHRMFEAEVPDRERLSAATGWPRNVVDSIDAYRGSPTRYTFPTSQQIETFSAPWFSLSKTRVGNYELAERCPTISLARNELP